MLRLPPLSPFTPPRLTPAQFRSAIITGSFLTLLGAQLAMAAPSTADAFRSADLAVQAQVVNDDHEEQFIQATLTNRGPNDSAYPLLAIHTGDAHIVSHDGDPTPQSISDGVACESGPQTIQCSYTNLGVGQAVTVRIKVKVPTATTAIVVARAQQTPDNNPVVNNRTELALQPSHVTVTETGQTATESATARRERVTWTLRHTDGRPAPIQLRVEADRPTMIYPPTCPIEPTEHTTAQPAGRDGSSTPPSNSHGVRIGPGKPWTCTITTMKPGQSAALVFDVDRPGPKDPTLTIRADAKADLPTAQAVNTSFTINPRTGVPGRVQRLSGAERAETAANVSQQRFAQGSAQAIVLARGDEPADALTGAPLAVNMHAPVLLTSPTAIPAVTQAEIERAGGTKVPIVLLGGPVAISPRIEQALQRAGHPVTRVAGPTRTETAAAIARRLGSGPRLVANGFNPDDAVVAASAMAANGGAVLLTAGSVIPPSVERDIRSADGAVGAVAGQATKLKTYAGTTPSDTALVVANTFFPGATQAVIARSGLPADALSGGALAGERRAPLLLVDSNHVSSSTLQWLADSRVTELTILGGTNAISEQVVTQLTDTIAR
ncbi:cell wall-binding repeat-containing protein [Stomatohabitans albus]|uniref:cell wall-binding repeat-containing protein n=1 Tax=Stomatohabitans albus TaxID=3110766 RepID=UPI00300CB07B